MTSMYLGNPSDIVQDYKRSIFHLTPAPEFATGENLASSLYRAVGFKFSEQAVTQLGKKFKQALDSGLLSPGEILEESAFRDVVGSLLASPRQPGQQKETIATMVPLVPSMALFSGSARQVGNPWNPGELIKRMIEYGCGNIEMAKKTWDLVFEALDVQGKGDPWANWAESLFQSCRPDQNDEIEWSPPENSSLEWRPRAFEPDFEGINWGNWATRGPSVHFVKDIKRVLSLKPYTTRRQWISLLESFLRISCAAHVAWICKANEALWQYLLACLRSSPTESVDELNSLLYVDPACWNYGEKIMPQINFLTRGYITARSGINLLLSICEKKTNTSWPGKVDLNSPLGIQEFGQYVYEHREKIDFSSFKKMHVQMLESNPGLLACTNGVTRNISFFFRYTLGQRQTLNVEQKSYDQGFWAKKSAEHKNAPWIISAGPVSLMTMATCCGGGASLPRTIEDFCKFMRNYGLVMAPRDMSWNGLGDSLRMLGLVVDSPDAEGGMVIQDPFLFSEMKGGISCSLTDY